MLTLYLDKLPDEVSNMLEYDVEELFKRTALRCADNEKKAIMEIEQGELIDSGSYIDRFGYKLRIDELSTGCKAVLCVLNHTDKIINFIECGLNARDYAVKHLNDGAIMIGEFNVTFMTYGFKDPIDVKMDGYRFTDLDRLNTYLKQDFYYGVDLTIPGICKL